MTIEKWLKEEKMRLGRFKIYCVNAQKEGLKSLPLKMPQSCWSGQYRTWDDSLDALSIRSCHPQHATVGEKPIVQYQITGTPKPLANPTTECHTAWENPTLLVA